MFRAAMTPDQAAQVIQVAYPQVYLACHTRHLRKRSTVHRLSARDAAILSHLEERVPLSQARLTAHLGVAKSTVSEALKRLAALGYISQTSTSGASSGLRRGLGVLLTPHGTRAIRDTSVLETERLRRVLALLSPRERERVATGLATLARACRRFSERRRARRPA